MTPIATTIGNFLMAERRLIELETQINSLSLDHFIPRGHDVNAEDIDLYYTQKEKFDYLIEERNNVSKLSADLSGELLKAFQLIDNRAIVAQVTDKFDNNFFVKVTIDEDEQISIEYL